MNTKILIAIDESDDAMKAVHHVASVVGGEIEITLLYVLPVAPKKGIEKEKILVGHHLVFKEGVESYRALLAHKREEMERVMEKAKSILINAGMKPEQIKTQIQDGKRGVARDILHEVNAGKYDTVVVGRRGLSAPKSFFSGSVSSKIFHHAKGCAVWVVE